MSTKNTVFARCKFVYTFNPTLKLPDKRQHLSHKTTPQPERAPHVAVERGADVVRDGEVFLMSQAGLFPKGQNRLIAIGHLQW